jgi:hypothetical protein
MSVSASFQRVMRETAFAAVAFIGGRCGQHLLPEADAARQGFDTQSQCGFHLRRLPVEGVDFLSGYVADKEGSIARSEAGPGAGTKRDGEGTNFFQVHNALEF